MEISQDYLETIIARRTKARLPRNPRDEMLELFLAKINAGNIADGYPKTTFPRVAKMLEGIPTGDLHAVFQRCSTYRKFGAGLRYELAPRSQCCDAPVRTRNVRDRSPIGSGSSRHIMTGVHEETHCTKCMQRTTVKA